MSAGWSSLPGESDDEPSPVRQGLDRLLDHLTGATVATTATVFERWPTIVGRSVAAHTQPLKLREGVLTVAVDDPAWASQLRFLAGDLLERLVEEPGGARITRLDFVVRGWTKEQ